MEDEGPYGPAVLLVVSNRDEGTPPSVVPPHRELDGTEMVTIELETPEDGIGGTKMPRGSRQRQSSIPATVAWDATTW
ncbi:hypothetical protein VMCG_06880 [Cytospora schulzeri]|uniref:Uncharacterized protein n=1 Tax=Cytospora schulzeri TaxID=448051 RepID=A0A423W220_9PEZI|nr:hypothetical protein VMCG_06880 [Valsa malicola]